MQTFKDKSGHEWTLTITVDAIKRVQSLVGVNMARILQPREGGDTPLVTELQTDILLFCGVIYALVKPQSQLSEDAFAALMDGDALAAAHAAFWEELISFFRSLPNGQAAMTAIQQHNAILRKSSDAVATQLQTLGNSAGNSLASSASTPDP